MFVTGRIAEESGDKANISFSHYDPKNNNNNSNKNKTVKSTFPEWVVCGFPSK